MAGSPRRGADAFKQFADVQSMRAARVAEGQTTTTAPAARVKAKIKMREACLGQVDPQPASDLFLLARTTIQPAEARAKAETTLIVEDPRAAGDVLKTLAERWPTAGDKAVPVFLLQKLDAVLWAMTSIIAETTIDRVILIDIRGPRLGTDRSPPTKAVSMLEQMKRLFRVDLAEKLGGTGHAAPVATPRPSPAPRPRSNRG